MTKPYAYNEDSYGLGADDSRAYQEEARTHEVLGGNVNSNGVHVPVHNTDALLNNRGATHGDFTDHARITFNLKRVMENGPNWTSLTDVQKESLHMIVHKIGRILAGNPNHQDHWDDIAGYARLVSQRLPATK